MCHPDICWDFLLSKMENEGDAEAASASAADSDGSVSWEDFFGEYRMHHYFHYVFMYTYCIVFETLCHFLPLVYLESSRGQAEIIAWGRKPRHVVTSRMVAWNL